MRKRMGRVMARKGRRDGEDEDDIFGEGGKDESVRFELRER